MIRPFVSETERYGEYSKAGEYVYDYPFLWGSRRTGPDLWRMGDPNSRDFYRDEVWHFKHFEEPQQTSSGTIMPRYSWLLSNDVDTSTLQDKMKTIQFLNASSYTDERIEGALAEYQKEATAVTNVLLKNKDIKEKYGEGLENKEVVAMIAYIQRIGTDIIPKK